ncbi:MAG: ferrous iron transport protein B [Sebaldella sp.]|nr:ferrous iron transport protein B [Sebaldella sp.]
MIKIAFVGNPNVGKTAIINKISNASLKIGNWAGVTIEKKEVFFKVDNEEINLVDLPGIYSLTANTPEEMVSRNFILDNDVDVIINVVDSTALEKNLYLTALLKEIGKPMIMALNYSDEFKKINYSLEKEVFEKQVGMESVFTSGRTGEGIDELLKKAVKLAKLHKDQSHIPYTLAFDNIIEEEIMNIKKKLLADKSYNKLLVKYPLDWVSIKTLEEDINFLATVKTEYGIDLRTISEKEVKNIKDRYDMEPADVIARARYGAIRGIVSTNLKKSDISKFAMTDKIDKILLNKFFGMLSFFIIIYVMFVLIFDGSAPFIDWVDGFFSDYIIKYVGKVIEGVPAWLNSFVLDGILASIGAVLTFVPLMFFIYFFMSILEESGYMARVAFLMNKAMTKVGLSGKAFIPMLIGFGCTVPAIYSTRTLEDERTRRLTGFIATFMSCGARLPVYSLLAAAFFSKNAAIVIVSMYFIGVIFALLMASILKRFAYFKGDNTELLIELPPYRVPSFKVVWNNMYTKTMMYVKRAATIILGILLVIWFFGYFPGNGDIQESYLAKAAKVVQPVFKPTGFADRWEPVASLVPSVIAKETVVAFFGQVLLQQQVVDEEEVVEYNFLSDTKDQIIGLGAAGIDSVKALLNAATFHITTLEPADEETLEEDAGGDIIPAVRSLWDDQYGGIRAYSFMLFVLLVVPCAVALGALKQEFGWKLVLIQIGVLLVLPYVVSTLFFNIAKLIM